MRMLDGSADNRALPRLAAASPVPLDGVPPEPFFPDVDIGSEVQLEVVDIVRTDISDTRVEHDFEMKLEQSG